MADFFSPPSSSSRRSWMGRTLAGLAAALGLGAKAGAGIGPEASASGPALIPAWDWDDQGLWALPVESLEASLSAGTLIPDPTDRWHRRFFVPESARPAGCRLVPSGRFAGPFSADWTHPARMPWQDEDPEVRYPTAAILWRIADSPILAHSPMGFNVDPDTWTVEFWEPTPLVCSSARSVREGRPDRMPDDIRVVLAVARDGGPGGLPS